MPRNNILLQRLPAPKQVQLPNGKVFFCKISKSWQKQATRTCKDKNAQIRIRMDKNEKYGPNDKKPE